MKINRTTIETFEEWSAKAPPQETIRAQSTDDALREQVRKGPADPKNVLSVEGLPIQLQDLLSEATQDFGHIKLVGEGNVPLILRKATIWKLEVQNVGELCFEDCKIGDLVTHGAKPTYEICNCMIGNFRVWKGYPVQRLEWNGGYLGQFHLDKDVKDAFVGDVWFSRDFTLPEDPAYHDVQWLRDTREALNARSNSVAAGIFHASELALSLAPASIGHFVWHLGSMNGAPTSETQSVSRYFGFLRPLCCSWRSHFLLALSLLAPQTNCGDGSRAWKEGNAPRGCFGQGCMPCSQSTRSISSGRRS